MSYTAHVARCTSIGARPLTFAQFLRITAKL